MEAGKITPVRVRRKLNIAGIAVWVMCGVFVIRLIVIMGFAGEYYESRATDVHERQRAIKAMRGDITDRNGVVLATSKPVCTISVIHSQITDADRVTKVLSEELKEESEAIAKKVAKVSVREKIKSNVDKEIGDRIREYKLDGVKVDEDYRRYYPYGELASKLMGFTGADNQGILGLEAKYDSYLAGRVGYILTTTDAKGIELNGFNERRIEPVSGKRLRLTIDYNIQCYANQLAAKTQLETGSKHVSIIVMNPNNGELLAMVNTPEYDLNDPYGGITDMTALNAKWRNNCISDTYEPGSIFKMVTATAALETGVCTLSDTFSCGGACVVADRRIRCHKLTGHGHQTFTQTVMNSCNPAFIEWGRRVGVSDFYKYMGKLGLLKRTGIDMAGEATTIIHKQSDMGEVELATCSFGQSFQITALQMIRAASAIVNGGRLVTPHFAMDMSDDEGNITDVFDYRPDEGAILKSTSDTMKSILHAVVAEGGGNKAYLENYSIGGKTATSEKLPRGSGRYIASFVGFAQADEPQVIAMCLIDEPVGAYYGGTIAAPVIKELMANILPYLEL